MAKQATQNNINNYGGPIRIHLSRVLPECGYPDLSP